MQLATNIPSYETPIVNNYELFHENYTADSLARLPDWNDDADYSLYSDIRDVLRLSSPEDLAGRSITVRVPIEMVYSSAADDAGFDRTVKVNTPDGLRECKKHLNREFGGEKKGYSEDDAGVMVGYLRITEDGEAVILKTQGNNRIAMKLLANRGQSTYVLMYLKVHPVGASEQEMIRREAENHFTDAQERRGQNENDKLRAGIAAGDRCSTDAMNFLREAGMNYRNLWQQLGVDELDGVPVDDLVSLNALTGMTSGEGNGWFSTYGRSNILAAARILSKVCIEITGEREISSTSLASTALLVKSMTEYGFKTNETPLFTKEEIDRFVYAFFKTMNKNDEEDIFSSPKVSKTPKFGVCELKSKQAKNYAFIMVNVFWPKIRQFYAYKQNSTRSFGAGTRAGEYILSQCTDRFLSKEVRRILDEELP